SQPAGSPGSRRSWVGHAGAARATATFRRRPGDPGVPTAHGGPALLGLPRDQRTPAPDRGPSLAGPVSGPPGVAGQPDAAPRDPVPGRDARAPGGLPGTGPRS